MSKLICVLLLLFPIVTFGQNWVNSIGNTGSNYGRQIALDRAKNVYITGSFYDTVDIDPSDAVYNLVSNGGGDIFLARTDSAGKLVWAKSFGTPNNESFTVFEVDEYGNTYLGFSFLGTLDLEINGTQTSFVSEPYNTSSILFKADKDGNVQWAKVYERSVALKDVEFNLEGNLIVSGTYSQLIFDVTIDNSGTMIGDKILSGIFIASYDTTSKALLAVSDLKGGLFIHSMEVSKESGRLVLAADISSNSIIPFEGKDSVLNISFWHSVISLVELNSATLKVTKVLPYRISFQPYVAINNIGFDRQGNFIIVGYCGNGVFDAGLTPGDTSIAPEKNILEDIIMIKYDPQYKVVWNYRFTSEKYSRGYGLTVDNAGDIYISASNAGQNSLDIEPGPGTTIITGGAMVAKYSAAGSLLWGKNMNAPYIMIFNITADENGVIYGIGIFRGENAKLNPDDNSIITSSAGFTDAFYFRYFPSGITAIQDAGNIDFEKTMVYPNPCKNMLNINGEYECAILYDFSGKPVTSYQYNGLPVDISELPAGIYMLLIQGRQKSYTVKVVKE